MTNEEMLKYCQSRVKTYTFHKLNLKGVTTLEAFNKCAVDLIDDINDDSQVLLDIEKSGQPVPKTVVQGFASLGAYSDNVMQYYCRYKQLMGF